MAIRGPLSPEKGMRMVSHRMPAVPSPASAT